jgi:hypothetical protein
MNYSDFRSRLQDIDRGSEDTDSLVKMFESAAGALSTAMGRYGHSQDVSAALALEGDRLFIEHLLRFDPIQLSCSLIIPGDQRLKEEELLRLARMINQDQSWANDALIEATFANRILGVDNDVDLMAFDVLFRLAIHQRAIL